MKTGKAFIKRLFIIAFSLLLCIPNFGTQIYAASGSVSLADGDYVVDLQEASLTDYNYINIFPRAVIMARSGKYTLMVKIHGYDQWSTLQLFEQPEDGSVTKIKAGTNWEAYDGKTMEGYDGQAQKLGDETQNDYWTQISESAMVDPAANTGILTFALKDISDVFAIGGYAETTYNDKLLNVLNVQRYRLKLESITSSSPLAYLAYGWDAGVQYQIDSARTIPIVPNIQYDNTYTPTGLFEGSFVESTTCVGGGGKVSATVKIKEDAAEQIEGVYQITGTDLNSAFARHATSTEFKAYLLGTYGNVYGENIYNAETNSFTIDFEGSGAAQSLMMGLDVKIVTKETPAGYRAVLYLTEDGMSMRTFTDEATNTSYTTYAKYIPSDAEFSVKEGEEADSYAVKQIKDVADGDNWRAYTFALNDEEGNACVPEKGGYVRIPIPLDWDMDNIYIASYQGQSKNTDSETSFFWKYATVSEEDGERYLRFTNVYRNNWINGGSIVMCQVLKEEDLTSLSENGIYEATVKFIKADTDSTLSMANGALETDAIIKVENGQKEVYLNFHPIVMNEEDGWYAYLGAIWDKEMSDCVIYDYEVDEAGNLLDNAGFDAITEFACLKSVKISLSDDTITDNSYTLKVIPPAMGADLSYEEVLSDPIDANLKFYNVKKVEDESTVSIPSWQKSVLRRSIDKAERYNEESYSAESWKNLTDALEEAKTYYESLAGTDAGTNQSVSNEIKAKSDAIENAINALSENPELVEARANLKAAIDEAREVELGDKTVSAFNELQSAINAAQATYERSNVSADELNEQITALNSAVQTFECSASASTLIPTDLEDGSYKVYVDMKKTDRNSDSMSNNAIGHWINLEVKDGEYTATIDFNGMTISGQFGYLRSLYYYDKGYVYNNYGEPQGTLKEVTVVSTQKNADGSDVVDTYNKADGYLYPDVVSFPLVDKGTEEYVPLQVFVPIMEAITPGTGTQNVLMKIDWTSLRLAGDTAQDVFTFDTDGVYTLTSSIREAGNDDTSVYANYLKEARILTENDQVQVYLDFRKITDGDAENFIKSIEVLDSEKNYIDVDTVYDTESGEIVKAVFTLPVNVELTDIKLTDNNDNVFEGRLYLALRSAQLQSVDKTNLEVRINEAEGLLEDGKNYTEVSRKALEEALADAKEVFENPVAVSGEVSSTGLTLRNAIAGLEEVTEQVDKSVLATTIENAKKISNEDGTYTEESFAKFQNAINAAEAVYNDEDATKAEVDAQVTALEAAYAGLVKTDTDEPGDKEALEELIKEAEELKGEDYTAASWAAIESAFNAAVAVYNKDDALQAEIDAQVQMLRAAINALIPVQKTEDGQLADGIYEINGQMIHATNKDQLSMGDGALTKPMYLIVKDGQISLQMKFGPLTIPLGDTEYTGYLGELGYLTYEDDAVPGSDEEVYAPEIEFYYEGYDGYNDPEFGTDAYMTSLEDSRYPEVVTIPVTLNDEEIWVQVYVPVMEAITAGTGRQFARLQLDWSSVNQIRDENIDLTALKAQIENAANVEQGNASEETWEALQKAIISAQEVYDNLSSTQEQVDAQILYLQKAMAAVSAENQEISDKTALQMLISQAEEKLGQNDIYTAESLAVLASIKEQAELIYADAGAEQSQVDAMAKSLEAALNNLVEKTQEVDTSALEAKIAEAEELAAKTDVYTESSINALKIAIRNAGNVLAGSNITENSVKNQINALQAVIESLKEKENVDRSGLEAKIAEAKTYLDVESSYTASSIAALKTAIINAQEVYQDANASQLGVNAQISALESAISGLVKANDNNIQDITKLADGVYSITGNMVKIDKVTASMSDNAINHTVKLTVKDGKYYITLDFKGLTVGEKLGYLSQLKYFTTGYALDQYGNPVGNLADVTVESYQKNEDGTLVSDNYGTNYPDVVTFELIPEALKDGFVPLQVFVPIMDSITLGTGTQPVFLKLDWSTLKSTTEDDPDFSLDDNNGNSNNNNNGNGTGNGNSALGGGSTLGGGSSLSGGSTLGGGSSLKSGTSSLSSGGSGLKSGSSLKSASSVKTDDEVQPMSGWMALLVCCGLVLVVIAMEKKSRKNAQ